MNPKPDLAALGAFVAIVEHCSFRKAADELGVSPSSLSHVIRSLESKLGVRLLHRTTRSVAPSEAGLRLFERLKPVLSDFDEALGALDDFRQVPSGPLRINASEPAVRLLLEQAIPTFIERYPHITLDISAEGRLVDIVAEGYDAGIRLGESLPQDMIAVRFGGDLRFIPVASPAYLQGRLQPQTPDDLHQHRCIGSRMPSGKRYHWEFEKHGQALVVDVPGPLILDHPQLMVESALAGLGIAYVPDRTVRAHLEDGSLVALLEDWCPAFPGLFLYYPGHRHVPAVLKAFIEVVRKCL